MEAGAFGLPVVANRRGGLPEIVADDETGFLVDANAPEQIADKLALLIGDPEGREGHGVGRKTEGSARTHARSDGRRV